MSSTTEATTDNTGSQGRLARKAAAINAALRVRFDRYLLQGSVLSVWFLVGLAPAFVALVVTIFTDFAPVNPGARVLLWWTPGETAVWGLLAVTGLVWAVYREARSARLQLAEVRHAEENRRAIAAIGVAASWDLDLERLYQRVSQDLKSILQFDRFTITGAMPTGRMRVEFTSGDPEDGPQAGALLPEAPDEPDGLYPERRSRYGSRLTVMVPACNGTLTVRAYEASSYTPADLDLLRQAAAQISPGIANAILFKSSEQRLQERTTLADIGRAANSALDPSAVIMAVDSSLSKLITYDHLGVVLTNEREEARATGDLIYWSNAGLSGRMAGDTVPLNIDAISLSDVVIGRSIGFAETEPQTAETEGTRVWLQVPLVVRERLIGILILSSDDPDAFGEEEASLLLNISLQVAPAIQNANLTASLKRRADERRTVAAIGLAANRELKLDAIYEGVARELETVLRYDRLSIMLDAPDSDETEESVEPDYVSQSDDLDVARLKSKAFAALGAEPNVLGNLQVESVSEDAYDRRDTEFMEQIASQITPAIQNARMIAAERELRETLDRQNQELFEANNARKQFLSSVSHELKTPLTIISGFIDLLATDDSISEEEKNETLSIIRRNANQLDVLINDILDISRMDAGTFKINPEPFCVNELVADLEASFQSLLRTKTQTLVVKMADDEVWVDADRGRISQVVTNLLSNASKYSPEETQITLACEIDGERLHIAVKDQGSGIDEEQQKRLFTAFFRVDNEATRKVSGTGLGLVIAKSVTELHGGEIRLASRVGEGTTVEFWLPNLTNGPAAEVEAPDEPAFMGSRLWPDGPPEEIGLGAD